MKQNLSNFDYNNSTECCLPCTSECKKVEEKVNGRELKDLEKSEIHEILDLFNNRYLMRTFILAKMLDKCSFKKSDSILVIGCLTGYSLALLSNMVSYVFGIDSNKEAIEKADKNLNGLNILNCSVFHKKDLSSGLDRNAPYDKIFIEGSVSHIPEKLVKQLKEDGEIYTVIKNIDEPIGFFVRGLKIQDDVSFTKIFNTNVSINNFGRFLKIPTFFDKILLVLPCINFLA